jgi:hypothetical protein
MALAHAIDEEHAIFDHLRIELVAYTLEEPPHFGTKDMGSYRHAADLIMQQRQGTIGPVIGMICLEMLGYYTDKPKSQNYPNAAMLAIYPDRGNFLALVSNSASASFLGQLTTAAESIHAATAITRCRLNP